MDSPLINREPSLARRTRGLLLLFSFSGSDDNGGPSVIAILWGVSLYVFCPKAEPVLGRLLGSEGWLACLRPAVFAAEDGRFIKPLPVSIGVPASLSAAAMALLTAVDDVLFRRVTRCAEFNEPTDRECE